MSDKAVRVFNFEQVTPFLYRGGLPDETAVRDLHQIGVKTILDFTRRLNKTEARLAKELGMDYRTSPWTAYWHKSIFFSYYRIITDEFLRVVSDKTTHPLYVHCFHGRDRTGMLIASYRMAFENWPVDKAITEMKKFKFKPWRHWDLLRFLRRYEIVLERRKAENPGVYKV